MPASKNKGKLSPITCELTHLKRFRKHEQEDLKLYEIERREIGGIGKIAQRIRENTEKLEAQKEKVRGRVCQKLGVEVDFKNPHSIARKENLTAIVSAGDIRLVRGAIKTLDMAIAKEPKNQELHKARKTLKNARRLKLTKEIDEALGNIDERSQIQDIINKKRERMGELKSKIAEKAVKYDLVFEAKTDNSGIQEKIVGLIIGGLIYSGLKWQGAMLGALIGWVGIVLEETVIPKTKIQKAIGFCDYAIAETKEELKRIDEEIAKRTPKTD